MLKNHILIALRGFKKHKFYTLINIGGLTVGLATAILIFQWVEDERGMDQFHEKGAHLYTVIQESTDNQGKLIYGNNTPGPMGPALKEEIPEIEAIFRMTYPQPLAVMYKDQQEGMENGIFADPELLSLLSFKLVEGSAGSALSNPNNIVLSESMASRYFHQEDPIGKAITISDGFNTFGLQVTGVLEDTPGNSSLQFDYIIPFEKFLEANEWAENWGSSSFITIIQLNAQASLAAVDQKVEPFFTQHHGINTSKLFLQSFQDRYLYGDIKPGRVPAGRITYVQLFTWVGIFILLIACINFMNLATARAGIRTREVGVRKVIGANRSSLVSQFMTEAILLSMISATVAVLLAKLLIPSFNQLTGKVLEITLLDIRFVGSVLALALITGSISGSYPAFFLSAFQPVRTLKGQLTKNFKEALFRKVLVVFQFTLSVALVIATVVIYYQIHYIKNKNLGMDRENIIFLSASSDITLNQEPFSNELMNLPGIQQVTFTNGRPSEVYSTTHDPIWEGMKEGENLGFRFMWTGHDFIKTMDMELVSGRDFSREISLDTLNYILNETAVEMMGLDDPLGKSLDFWGRKGEIIGVVKDFHYNSMHEKIDPFIILLWPENTSYAMVKTQPGKTQEALASLQTVYKKFVPDYPFEYSFLDDDFERVYKSELLIGRLANYFTVMVILISCLGLFGLASFTAERRAKEIGVRKVLGASLSQVVGLISKDFLPLVILALLLASPFAWYLMNGWLNDFYYKIDLKPWIFLAAGLVSVIIALLTVSYQAIKAGLANPVDALRSE
ncbi:MAG: ABC transporter permease [Cyclobacteriaceae bacterium]|nr:MAG: ABC transporter permease [Cyclobacteriaceae bacterium]